MTPGEFQVISHALSLVVFFLAFLAGVQAGDM